MASDDITPNKPQDSKKETSPEIITPDPRPKPSSAGDESSLNPQPLPPKATTTSGTVKNRKKLWITIGIVVAILALIGGGLYYYSNSRKVLADAMTKTITTDTGTFKGIAEFETKNSSTNAKVKVDIDGAQVKDLGQVDVKAKVSVGALDFNLDASAITAKDEVYFKINNAKQLGELALGFAGNNKEMIELYKPLIEKIDNKWIKVDDQEQEASKCTKAMSEFSLSSADQKNMRKLFEKNEFVKADSAGGSFSEHHYKLGFDKNAAGTFAEEVTKLDSFKKVKAECDTDSLVKGIKEPDNSSSRPTVKAELWVNRWSHKPTKMMISVDDKDAKLVFNSSINLGEKKNITKPTDAKPMSEITKEFQQQLSKSMGTSSGSATEPMTEAEIQQLLNATMTQ